jgi:hypothetical protein
MAVVASTPLASSETARDGAHNNSTRKAAKYFMSIPSLKSNWQRYYTLLKGWTESLWSGFCMRNEISEMQSRNAYIAPSD